MAEPTSPKRQEHLRPVSAIKSSLRATVKDQSGAGKIRIGELLCREGHITRSQLEEALIYQKKHKGRLGSLLLELGYIEEETIVNILSRLHNYPAVIISRASVDPKALKILPYNVAKGYMAFPLKVKGETLEVSMAEPTDTSAVEELQNEVQMDLKVAVSTEKGIIEAYKKYYKISDEEYNSFFGGREKDKEEDLPVIQIDDFGSLVSEAAGEMELETPVEEDDGLGQYSAADAPIIKLVNGILMRAVNEGVSDIHVEPFEKSLQVRYRMDGSLYKCMNLPLTIKNALISRVKVLSGLNIAERRVPQDGRIKMRLGKRKAVDFRVSTLPTLFGESIVMRILDPGSLNVDLTKLGFEQDIFETLKRCILRPYGLLLVTGPTGSGKTTTLYSILNVLNKEDTKILTAEDPVEFNFKGINQVHVKTEIGMTFAAALRSFLRQDPDIIMVGEIRDMETAEIAIKAAMTGHLVLSTLHTNDCPSTIGRLVDIGIPPYMLASAVTMVLSQRLVRRLCSECKTVDKKVGRKELEIAGFSVDEIPHLTIYGPKGCSACNGTGYKGRVGLYELMEVTDEVGKAINASVAEDQLRKIAGQEGMVLLRKAGLEKMRQGLTSVEEVMQRTVMTKDAMPAYLVNPDIEHYDDEDVIIREGNKDSDFFKLVQGTLIVAIKGRKIGEIATPGEYFGEMAAISGEPRSATIISRGRTTVKRFPGDKLLEIIEKYPEIATELFEMIVNRLRSANNLTMKLADKIMKRAKNLAL
ncbi:MAG: type IV-A pilus assembly ATPase PilB [Thermodesulfobacteriota bacterium]|nr:type IV-A pilus assembly ATPase PilB [Thermodesulfobacteriota bacterium]